MNALARRWAVGLVSAAAVGMAVFGGAVLANSATAPVGAPAMLAQLSIHGPGNGDTEIPTGPGVVVAKPSGGGTSNAKCVKLTGALNEDLQDLAWANRAGNTERAAVDKELISLDKAAGFASGCTWAK
jgi:hypothetical protein